MNINRAGKQQKAFWRSEEALADRLTNEKNDLGVPTCSYQMVLAALRGHAAGWIAGVRWAKINAQKENKYENRSRT